MKGATMNAPSEFLLFVYVCTIAPSDRFVSDTIMQVGVGCDA